MEARRISCRLQGSSALPALRWGIIYTAAISSLFHIITAIGSSSKTKGLTFVKDHLSGVEPAPEVYAGYDAHVLCEKSFTLNVRTARVVFRAAQEKAIIIGDVLRVFADIDRMQNIQTKDMDSRLRNVELGAGSLLDIGINSVTWRLLALEDRVIREDTKKAGELQIKAARTLQEDIDVASTVILYRPSIGQQAICTSTSNFKNSSREFCRIEGSEGHIVIEGEYASRPSGFVVYKKGEKEGERHGFLLPGASPFYEADVEGRIVRIMEMIDKVRRQSGARFPGDL
ncbi:hypothetical protein BU25DRAFT_431577 [Macroventuria anomochaeta]|uniref:Uncharacterized protein n=1 Tax=Macroventuria anomochaeta TaxID=301207 RepID=A0ACB6RZH4_9PLEO|nr:uncharacterized protein BU25DRAFT_431577 [Macroventuria anomochaeta]KAF2627425.1 hypothetical protein BU25DRAFT_431577 [Macroventuria anomochaeta]